jgi:hypothetical protein
MLALSGALLFTSAARSSGQSLNQKSAARCWVDGKIEAVASTLADAPRTRENELNRAIVQLYAGQATEAVSVLAALRDREGGWTPALRWLARAQAQLGRPESLESAGALLARRDANLMDQLWAGGLFLKHGRPQQARSAFQSVVRRNGGIDAAWGGLAEAEAQLGHADSARKAEERALELGGGGWMAGAPASGGESLVRTVLVTSVPQPAETLRYKVKYLFLRVASVRLDTEPRALHDGGAARRIVFSVKSTGAIPFFHIDSRFESLVGPDGAVLAHRHVASDSDSGADEAGYDMDHAARLCRVRTARDGVFGYEILPLPDNPQDGVSVLLVARALARTRGAAVVPTAVDAMWWPTRLRTLAVETIKWRGRDVRTVRMQAIGHYRGPGGLSGAVDVWISDDERAIPYKVKMKVAVGSVVLELLPDETLVARGPVTSSASADRAGRRPHDPGPLPPPPQARPRGKVSSRGRAPRPIARRDAERG